MQKMKKKPKTLTRAQQALAASDKAMQDKWVNMPKFGRTPAKDVKPLEAPAPVIRQTERPKSLMTPGGSTALKTAPQYTGDKMLGIATMHKSNAVPVFAAEEAKDISSMRRG